MLRRMLLTATVASLVLLGTANASKAAFTVSVSNGSISGIVTDQVVGTTAPNADDLNGNPNAIIGLFQIGNVMIQITSGVGDNLPSMLGISTTNLSMTTLGPVGPMTLTITTDAGPFSGAPNPAAIATSLSTSSLQGAISIDGYTTVNGVKVTGSDVAAGKFNGDVSNVIGSIPGSFTFGNVLIIQIGATPNNTTVANIGINSQIAAAAPAPSGLILAAGAVPFMGLVRRLRKSAVGVAA